MDISDLGGHAADFLNYNKDLALDIANKISQGYRQFLYKELVFIIGGFFYFCFFILSLVMYAPSYNGCLEYGGGSVKTIIILLHSVFLTLLLLAGLKGTMSPDFLGVYEFLAPKMMLVIVIGFFLVYGYLYFKCKDPVCTKQNPCKSPEDASLFNAEVTKQVDHSSVVNALFDFYENSATVKRTQIASCSNFYDATYRTAANMGAKNFSCSGSTGPGACIIDQDPSKGAPILAEFYVMTSNRTYVVSYQYDYYLSTRMIVLALKNGARCLDFDIFPLDASKNAIPVVTVGVDRGNVNLHHNYLTFQQCLRTIVQTWFKKGDTVKEDPLFLHLNIHPCMTDACCDQVAILLRYYFTEYVPDKLLPAEFNYKKQNIGRVPICLLFGKVIIMVRQVGFPTTPKPLTTSLEEITNALAGTNIKDKEWLEIKNVINKEEFAAFNRRSVSFVRTSMHPYDIISPESNLSGGTFGKVVSTSKNDDNVTKLILNKYTINNDPSVPIQMGCQFVAMNFQEVDSNMMKYLGFFERTSFVLKSLSLRRKDFLYTEPIVGKYGTTPAMSCDTANTDQNSDDMNGTHCGATTANVAVKAKGQDLARSYQTNTDNYNRVTQNPVFYVPGT